MVVLMDNHLLTSYCVPDTLLSVLEAIFYLSQQSDDIDKIALLIFTDKKIKALIIFPGTKSQ